MKALPEGAPRAQEDVRSLLFRTQAEGLRTSSQEADSRGDGSAAVGGCVSVRLHGRQDEKKSP